MGAAFGLEQLNKLPKNYERRKRNFSMYSEFLAPHSERIVLPRQTDGLDTAWLCYPIIVRPDAGFTRSDLQQFLESRDIDTRTVWTGNAVRQPMMKNVRYRVPDGGMPNADLVMTGGMILPMSHAIDDDGIDYVCEQFGEFLATH
jgi:CDP-6-deoxy-D-xylo-4-hexulose-3-dehydrase